MRSLLHVLGLASVASAHTLFTTFFIDGKNQGDGTCVRTPKDGETATAPIYPLDGDVMACGVDGEMAVNFICPAQSGSTLTFEFRMWPNAEKPGSISDTHKGPCAVYVKKVDDMFSDSASGSGWFKIWDDGYDADNDRWCVDTLIENNGLLSVNLPSGLPTGNYLVRPELLALHQAYRGDPQFFHGCAQVFIENGPSGDLDVPDEYAVSIPGYIKSDAPGLSFNLYEDDPKTYKMPGPKVFTPESSSSSNSVKAKQTSGKIPDNAILVNGNWYAKPPPKSSDVDSCYDSVDDCWAQSKKCWSSAPVTGDANCEVWADYCTSMGDDCDAGKYDGPAKFDGEEQYAPVPGDIPKPYNMSKRTDVSVGSLEEGGHNDEMEEPTPAETIPTVSTSVPEGTPVPSSGGLKISEDGLCGGETGQTCKGSAFGECCSKKGKCGRKTRHCACGCQSGFGECHENKA